MGLHGLLNTSFILNQNSYGFEEYDYKSTFGAGGGLVVGYNFTDHIGLQTELNFLKLGQNYQRSRQPVDTRRYELNYIAIPLMLKYTSGEGMVRFYGQIGPQVMFLNNAAIKYFDPDGTAMTVYPTAPVYGGTIDTAFTITGPAATARFEKLNVGLNFGLGANIHIIPSLYVNAGLSFYYGFSDINNADVVGTASATLPNAGSPYSDGTWRWPDQSLQKYEPSRNAYGGIDIGVHYMFLR